jgi:hypothetical protein
MSISEILKTKKIQRQKQLRNTTCCYILSNLGVTYIRNQHLITKTYDSTYFNIYKYYFNPFIRLLLATNINNILILYSHH